MTDFQRALEVTLRFEGGVSNHPSDHGGLTNQGVTQATYDQYRKCHALPTRPVTQMGRPELEAIYYTYWQDAHCEGQPWPVSLLSFDVAVNSGPARAVKFLQQACSVPVDGAWGPKTAEAVAREAQRPLVLAQRLLDLRKGFFQELAKRPGQAVFLKGWLNRVVALEKLVDQSTGKPAAASAEVKVVVNGAFLEDGLQVGGTVYVPARGIAEALGCTVQWDAHTRTVRIMSETQP